MKINNEAIYLAFIDIENILDQHKVEYQSLKNRIEFTSDDNMVIISTGTDLDIPKIPSINLFHEKKKYVFSFESNKYWYDKKNSVDLYTIIDGLIKYQ